MSISIVLHITALKIATVEDLIKFRLKTTKIIKLVSERPFESEMGTNFYLKVFKNHSFLNIISTIEI